MIQEPSKKSESYEDSLCRHFNWGLSEGDMMDYGQNAGNQINMQVEVDGGETRQVYMYMANWSNDQTVIP